MCASTAQRLSVPAPLTGLCTPTTITATTPLSAGRPSAASTTWLEITPSRTGVVRGWHAGGSCAYAWAMTLRASESDAVADALWDRVRRLAGVAEQLVQAEALGELDPDGQARLDRTRVRLRRAVERAQMADELSDQLADLRATRTRGEGP